jgi:hypothetical protein
MRLYIYTGLEDPGNISGLEDPGNISGLEEE